MASLLGWLGNKAKAVGAQINPFDNGATYSTVVNNQPVAPGPSVLHQIGQIGAGIAKPFVATGADVSNAIGNAEVGLAHALHLAPNVKTKTNVEQFGPLIGNYVGQNTPGNFARNVAQVGLSLASPGITRLAEAGATKILPSVVPKIVTKIAANTAAGAPIGGTFNTLGGGSFKSGAEAGALLGGLGTAAQGAGHLTIRAGRAAGEVGLPPQYRLSLEDRRALSDYTDYLSSNSGYRPKPSEINRLTAQVMNIGKKTGIDVSTGSPRDRSLRIGDFLQNFDANKQSIQQGGYVKVPKQPKVTSVVQNKLTVGGKTGKQNISPEVQLGISGEHNVRNTNKLQEMAIKTADKQSLNKTIQQAHEALSVAPGKIDDQTVALAQQAIERADKAGRLQDAIGIHDALSEHLVKQGQTIQAASLLYRLSPRGLFYKGLRDLKKAGTNVTPELETRLKNQSDAIKTAGDQASKERATALFHKTVADNLPKSAVNNALSIWKAGLLSGVKTQGGNFASNATFAGLKAVSNPIAAAVDRGISLVTGQRTKTATLRGLPSGAKQGVKTGIDTLKTGVDARNISGGKYEIHGELNFKNPVIQKVFGVLPNLVFRGMNAADQPFYYAALKNNLYDIAKADGINKGLTGKELANHITNTVANPTTKMAETAKLAAQKSVLGQDNKFASAVSTFAQSHPALQVLVPFVKVPTNFLSRTLDYSPVGAIKSVVQNLNTLRKGQGIDQRALSEAISEATTGSSLIYLGAELANHNLLSGQYPSNDPKEAARWKAEGIQPNSIKVGNTWISMNYLGPVGILFGAGKDLHDASVKGDNRAVAAIAGAGKSITGQSFLTGFSGFSNALNDPQRNAASFVNSQAGSVVPSLVNDAANLGDNKQRETNSPLDAAKARIPGVRNTLPVKLDTYGSQLEQRTDLFNLLANPLRPSNVRTNQVTSEVSRLHNVDPNNADLQVTPLPVKKTVKVEGQNINLTDAQRHSLQEKSGQFLQQKWGELIQTPEYQKLTDIEKATALNNLRTTADTLTTRQFITDNNLASYNKPLTKAAIGLANNGDVTSFIKKPAVAKQVAKTKTSKAPTTKKVSRVGRVSKPRKVLTPRLNLKSAAIKAPSIPKIHIAKATSFKAPKVRRLSVRKLPTNITKKRRII